MQKQDPGKASNHVMAAQQCIPEYTSDSTQQISSLPPRLTLSATAPPPPPMQMKADTLQRQEEQPWYSKAWQGISNSSLGGVAEIMEQVGKAKGNARLAGAGSTMGNVLAPLGMISGLQGMRSGVDKFRSGQGGITDASDLAADTAGYVSGGITTYGLAGGLLSKLGLAKLGGGMTAGAAALAPVAKVAGAGAAGYAAGRLMDNAVGWGMNKTGAGGLIDRLRGIQRPEGQHGDYSISGMGGDLMYGFDSMNTRAMRRLGVLDESKPEYTQTLGWKLAEILPRWMQ